MSLFILAVSGLAAAQSSLTSTVESTSLEVVESYTTFLNGPTTLVEGSQTYTVTAATNLTVTDCPCTRTHTYTTEYVTVCAAETVASQSVADVSSNGAISLSPAWFLLVVPLALL